MPPLNHFRSFISKGNRFCSVIICGLRRSETIVNLIFLQLLGTGSSDGVGQDEGAALGQTRGRDLHDLHAVALAHDALVDHLLAQIAVLHEAGVLLQEVGKLIRAEGDAALVGSAVVAQLLLSLQEQLIGVALGGSSRIGVAVVRGCLGQSLEHIILIPTPFASRRPVSYTAACFHAD